MASTTRTSLWVIIALVLVVLGAGAPLTAPATAVAEHVAKGSAAVAQAKTAEDAAAVGESARSWAEMPDGKLNISASEGQEKSGAAVGAAKDNTSETGITIHGQAKAGGTAGASKDLTAQAKDKGYDAAGAAKNNTVDSIDPVWRLAKPADERHVRRALVAVADQSRRFTVPQITMFVVGIFLTAGTSYLGYKLYVWNQQFQIALAKSASDGATARHEELMSFLRNEAQETRVSIFDIDGGLAHSPTDSKGMPSRVHARALMKVVFPAMEGTAAAE